MKTSGVLYSFRRCPYAIRARMALHYADIRVELREVFLKTKPQSMIDISPKATVPVFRLANGRVLEQSLDIMMWSLKARDCDGWYFGLSDADKQSIDKIIKYNDDEFKPWLDKYKYFSAHPEFKKDYYREQGSIFLQELEKRLGCSKYLIGDKISLADIAVFPFVRQFAFVDKNWFDLSEFYQLKNWLKYFLESSCFLNVMKKYSVWNQSDNKEKVIF